jgi:oligopeptide transport system permease protein
MPKGRLFLFSIQIVKIRTVNGLKMAHYVLKRLFAGILSIFVLITITFFLMHSIPGGPFDPAEERKLTPTVVEAINKAYGLNQPVHVQYLNYLHNVIFHWDLGISYKTQDMTVNEIIGRGLPVSAKVGTIAILAALAVGLPLGIIAALKRNRAADRIATFIATVGIAIPGFVIMTLMMLLFVYDLHLLPAYGLNSPKSYILPVIGLAFAPISYIARLIRSSMLDALSQDYIRTARAKGVGPFSVVAKHAMRNAIIPVVTYLGPLVAELLTGTFVAEKLFSIPGIGQNFVNSINSRDYSMILGLTLFLGIFVVVANLVVDILYVIIDPRVKFEKQV